MSDDKAEVQKHKACSTCGHWGTVFSYKRLAHEMKCGFGSRLCEEPVFGKQFPSGYVKRRER